MQNIKNQLKITKNENRVSFAVKNVKFDKSKNINTNKHGWSGRIKSRVRKIIKRVGRKTWPYSYRKRAKNAIYNVRHNNELKEVFNSKFKKNNKFFITLFQGDKKKVKKRKKFLSRIRGIKWKRFYQKKIENKDYKFSRTYMHIFKNKKKNFSLNTFIRFSKSGIRYPKKKTIKFKTNKINKKIKNNKPFSNVERIKKIINNYWKLKLNSLKKKNYSVNGKKINSSKFYKFIINCYWPAANQPNNKKN